MRTLVSVALVTTLVAASACSDHASTRARRGARSGADAPHAPGPGVPRLDDTEDTSVWSAPPTPLADELASTESLAHCTARVRASVSPDVAEVLADIGYGRLAEDTCGALAAVRDGDPGACDALTISAVRHGCRRRVALAKSMPEACPEDPLLDGHEPVCVAWATRRPALCRAAAVGDVARCEAVLANDPARCGATPSARDCRAEVRRYGGVLAATAPVHGPGDTTTPSFSLTLRSAGRSVTVDAGTVVARGALVVACAGVRRTALGPLSRTDTQAPLFVDAPTAWLTLARREDAAAHGPPELVLGPPGSADARLFVALPHRPAVTSDAGAHATVTLEALDATRGGRVAGTLRGTLHDAGEDVTVEGRFETFVRDVREGGDSCGG